MAGYFEIICGVAAVIFLLYYYFTFNFDFWKSRGVPGPKPIPGFGNVSKVMLLKSTMGDYLKEVYDQYKHEPMVGIFIRRSPLLIVNDPDLIKDVLVKDFSKMPERGMVLCEKRDPLSPNLFSLESKRWRALRTKLSPVFTSGKLRDMFKMIVECSEHFEEYIGKVVKTGEPVECRELTAKYTTDVIGTCAFGIEVNALSDKENEFRRAGRQLFATDVYSKLRVIFRHSLPWLYNALGYIVPPVEHDIFFEKMATDTMNYRKKNNILRNDFINVLLELQRHPEKVRDVKLTDTFLAAQAFVFFAAGFETSSTAMSNALYELALNPDIQDKLRKEIREEFEKNGDELKYENVKKLTYLDKVFKESLRKYPAVMFLMRFTVDNYTFEGTKVSIPKGQKVWIPVYAIHRDPDIYPNPDVFDPERFSETVAATRHPMHYLPFGDGPRNCIGARFAIYQSKVGLMKILHKFKVDVCEKTQIPYINDSAGFLLSAKGGTYLKITKAD